MTKTALFVTALFFTLTLFPPVASANDGLDARTHAKVMRAKRMQAMDQHAHPEGRAGLPPVGAPQTQVVDPCKAGIDIGNVYVDKNNRGMAPRENTVVVTGDVIFAPSRNCR